MTCSIAQAAERGGLSIDALRYRERIDLVDPPARDSGGRRSYRDDDLGWLVLPTRLRTTGMPIRVMREHAQLRHRASVRDRVAERQSCLEVLDHKITHCEDIEHTSTEGITA